MAVYRPLNDAKFDPSRLSAKEPLRATGNGDLYRTCLDGQPLAFQVDLKAAFGFGYWDNAAGKMVWNPSADTVDPTVKSFKVNFKLTEARHPDDEYHTAALNTLRFLECVYEFDVDTLLPIMTRRNRNVKTREQAAMLITNQVRGELDDPDPHYRDERSGEMREREITFSTTLWARKRTSFSDPLWADVECSLIQRGDSGRPHDWRVVETNVNAFEYLRSGCRCIAKVQRRPTALISGKATGSYTIRGLYIEPRESAGSSGLAGMDIGTTDSAASIELS